MASSEDWKAKHDELHSEFLEFQEISKDLEAEQARELEEAIQRQSALERENLAMREQLDSAATRMGSESQELNKVQVELESCKKSIEQHNVARRKLEQANDELESKIRILETTVSDSAEKLEKALEQQVMLETERDEIRESSEAQIQRFKDKISELESDIVAMSNRNSSDSNETGNGNGDIISEQLEELKAENARLKEDLADEQSQCDDLNNQIEEMTEEMISSHATLKRLEEELEAAKNQTSNLKSGSDDSSPTNSDLTEHLETISKLRDELAAKQEQVEIEVKQRTTMIQQLEEQISKTSKEMEAKTAQLTEALLGKTQTEKIVIKLQAQVSDLTSQIQALSAQHESESAKTEKDAAALGQQLEQVQQELRNSLLESEQLKLQVSELKTQNESLSSELSNAEAKTGSITETNDRLISDLRDRVAASEQKLNDIITERDEMSEKADVLEKRIQELCDVRDTLQGQLETMEQSMKSSSSEQDTKIKELEEQVTKSKHESKLLEESKSVLENQIEEVSREKDTLHSELESLKQSLDSSASEQSAKIQELEESKRDFESKMSKLVEERDSLQGQLNAMEQSMESSSSEQETKIKELEEQVTKSKHESKLLEEAKSALENQIEEVSQEKDTLHAELESLKQSLDSSASEQSAKIQELEESKRDFESKMSKLVEERDSLQGQLDAMEQSMKSSSSEQDTKIKELEEQVTKSKHESKLLEESKSVLENRIEEVSREKDTLHSELESLKQSLDSSASEQSAKIQELEESKRDFESKMSKLVEERDSLQGQLETMEQSMKSSSSEQDTKIKELEDELSQALSSLKEARSTVEQLTVKESQHEIELSAAKESLSTASSEVNRLKEQVTTLSQSISELQTEVGAMSDEKAKLNDRLHDATSKLEHLESGNTDTNTKPANLEQELDSMKQILEATTAEKVELTCDLDVARNEIEQLKASLLQLESSNALEANDETLKSEKLLEKLQAQNAELTELKGELSVRDGEISQLHDALTAAKQEIDQTKSELTSESNQLAALKAKLVEIQQSNISTKQELVVKMDQIETLSAAVEEMKLEKDALIAESNPRIDDTDGSNATISSELKALRLAYADQLRTNAELLARMQTTGGNVLVCCRVRPYTDQESEVGNTESPAVKVVGSSEIGFYNQQKNEWRPFAFDRVFGPRMAQRQVTNEIANLRIAESVVGGTTCCVIAYGQTGSGKTYTMDGPAGNPGANTVLIEQVFRLTKLLEASGEGQYQVRMSMVEIYNDSIRDLLGASPVSSQTGNQDPARTTLKVVAGGVSEMSGLTWCTCESVEVVQRTLEKGRENRATACTNLNEHSSRSHSIVMVEVRGVHGSDGGNETENDSQNDEEAQGDTVTVGTLYLVDLAGSERVAKSEVTGDRLGETKHINKSLSALGDVMEALDKKSRHIPYRNSKLTHMLKQAISPSSRLLVILTVPPLLNVASETLNSLKFAQRVRNINLGPAQQHIEALNARSSQNALRDELRHAKSQITRLESNLSLAKQAAATAERKANQLAAQESKAGEAHTRSLERLNTSVTKELNDLRLKHVSMKQAHKEEAALAESSRQRSRAELKVAKQKLDEANRLCADTQRKLELQQREISRLRNALNAADRNNRTVSGGIKRQSRGGDTASSPGSVRGGYDEDTESAARKRRPSMSTPAAKVFSNTSKLFPDRSKSSVLRNQDATAHGNGSLSRVSAALDAGSDKEVSSNVRPVRHSRGRASSTRASGTVSENEDRDDDCQSVTSIASAVVGGRTSRYALRSTASRIARIGTRQAQSTRDNASVTSTASGERFLAPTVSSRSKLRRPGFSKDDV